MPNVTDVQLERGAERQALSGACRAAAAFIASPEEFSI
jgi:hypothetical protein